MPPAASTKVRCTSAAKRSLPGETGERTMPMSECGAVAVPQLDGGVVRGVAAELDQYPVQARVGGIKEAADP
jgi:hypothetical protein